MATRGTALVTLSASELREVADRFSRYAEGEAARIDRDARFLRNMYVSASALKPQVPDALWRAASGNLADRLRGGE